MSDTPPDTHAKHGRLGDELRAIAQSPALARTALVSLPTALAVSTWALAGMFDAVPLFRPLRSGAALVTHVAISAAVLLGIGLLIAPDLHTWREHGDAAPLRRSARFAGVALVPWTAVVVDSVARTITSVSHGYLASNDLEPALWADLHMMGVIGFGWWLLAAVAILPDTPVMGVLAVSGATVAAVAALSATQSLEALHVRWPIALAFVAVVAAAVLHALSLPGVRMANQPVPAPNAPTTELLCSFCGKSQKVVRKLIAGPNVHICDECVALCNDILVEEAKPKEPEPAATDLPLIRAALDQACPDLPAVTPLLATAIYTQRVRRHGGSPALQPARVLIVGPRGCGKSSLVDAVVRAAGAPAVHTEASCLTETGYVGENVENFLAELVDAAGNVQNAEFGLLAIDGLHHLAARGPSRSGRDISGSEVQRDLLRMLDGRAAPLAWSRPRHPQGDIQRFPADKLMVLAAATVSSSTPTDDRSLRDALIADGFHDELIARFERIIRLPALDPVRAMTMLRRPDGPLARVRALAEALGVELVIEDAGFAHLAAYAAGPDGGWAVARAVSLVGEEVASGVRRVVVAGPA